MLVLQQGSTRNEENKRISEIIYSGISHLIVKP